MTFTLNRGFWSPGGGGAASTAEVVAQTTLSTAYSGGPADKYFVVGGRWEQSQYNPPHYCFDGQIDCVRISTINRYTSATSVSDTIDQPTSSFSTDSDTAYLMNFDAGSLANPDDPASISADTNEYTNGNNLDTTNTMFDSAGAWTGGSAAAALSYEGPAALNDLFGLTYNSAWTFECFIRPVSLSSTDSYNEAEFMTNFWYNPQFNFGLKNVSSALYLYAYWWHSSGAYTTLQSPTAINLNTWNYVAMTNTAGGNWCLVQGEVT